MRVLIVGSTGGTGRQLVAQGLERGHHVTALARNPAKVQLRHENLRVVRGDVLDQAVIDAAVEGQDAVLSALGHKRWFYPNRILSDGTSSIIRAMEKHGVRRLVCVTSLGVGRTWWRMGIYYTFFVIPFILPLYFWDKHRQESVIRASSVDWGHCPPRSTDQWSQARGIPSRASRRKSPLDCSHLARRRCGVHAEPAVR